MLFLELRLKSKWGFNKNLVYCTFYLVFILIQRFSNFPYGITIKNFEIGLFIKQMEFITNRKFEWKLLIALKYKFNKHKKKTL